MPMMNILGQLLEIKQITVCCEKILCWIARESFPFLIKIFRQQNLLAYKWLLLGQYAINNMQ